MFSDLKYIILWWSEFFILGAIVAPLTFALFKKFWDKGYIFSKVISTIVLTYLVLVLGIFHFLKFTTPSLLILVSFIILVNILYLKKGNNLIEFVKTIKSNWKFFIFEEILFLLILAIWSYVRGFAPDIEGLEKFMDWGFVNSSLRSTYMPPVDMWFSGMSINYYYFGHLVIAVLTKLSNLDSAITYNLAISSTCALTFVTSFLVTGF